MSSSLEFTSSIDGNGTLTAKSNTFSGKIYSYYSNNPIAVIEGGAIKGAGKDVVLTGTLKEEGKTVLFSVKWVSIDPPAVG